MALNVNPLSILTLSASSLANLILVTPESVGYQPQSSFQDNEDLPKFLFTYEESNRIELTSDITDHYTEDNTSLHDNISIAPDIVRVTGYVGELTNEVPAELEQLNRIVDKLETVGHLAPTLSSFAQRLYGNARIVYNSTRILRDKVISKWTNQGSNNVQNKQQEAFSFFYGYMNERRLFTLQTPWRVFRNMAIKSLIADQRDSDITVSVFEIEFKKINFVDDPSQFEPEVLLAPRLDNQDRSIERTGSESPNVETTFHDALGRINV